MKEWIVVAKYGGMKMVRAEFDTDKEAMEFMNSMLNADAKRKGPGARVVIHIYRKFGSYRN